MAKVTVTANEAADRLLASERLEEAARLTAELVAMEEAERRAEHGVTGEPVPADWRDRLRLVFQKHVAHPFADRHEQFWEHVNAIELADSPDPFAGIWPRGGGKSTGAELAVADLGCRDKRRYILYVRETQALADKSVANIAALLESKAVERHYPAHADRQLGKYGTSKGWKRERLTTAGGLTIDAIGLDTATRGLKNEEQRPDLIVFDDIDGKLDGPHITAKKETIITHSILPAGSSNCGVIFIQNLIIPDGIASKLADGRADYLVRRRVSGPFPAVEGLKYEWRMDDRSGIRRAVITAGRATWAGQSLDVCQRSIDEFGLSAFLKECQHQVKGRAEGVALRFDASRHYCDYTEEEARALVERALRTKGIAVFGGIDFGAWRFAFTLFVVTEDGVVVRLDEYFAQRLPGESSLRERAKAIHDLCVRYGIPAGAKGIPIWGDAANPTDILELNLAFRDGWLEEWTDPRSGQKKREHVVSRLRVIPVAGENKIRVTSVDRMNDLLDRSVLQFRRAVSYEWRYNMNAGSEGTPQLGSRLVWEMEQWGYPLPKAGEEQSQDPDDATADGADAIAAARYAVMSWWKPTKEPKGLGFQPDDKKPPFDYRKRQFVPPTHAADLLTPTGRGIPPVTMPRPRSGR